MEDKRRKVSNYIKELNEIPLVQHVSSFPGVHWHIFSEKEVLLERTFFQILASCWNIQIWPWPLGSSFPFGKEKAYVDHHDPRWVWGWWYMQCGASKGYAPRLARAWPYGEWAESGTAFCLRPH